LIEPTTSTRPTRPILPSRHNQRVPTRRSVADQLLDAQVAYLLAELDDEHVADTLTRAVDDVLTVARTLQLGQVADLDTVKEIARRAVRAVGSSPNLEDLVGGLADAIYANEGEYALGDTVAREPVEALIAHVIGMRTLQDRALERFTESPLVGVVAAKFVTTIISDFVQQNRQRAEKLPGMSSLFSLGQSAASRVPGMAMLGDAAGKGAQFAVKSTKGAMRDMMRDAPLQGAAMELWDLHADEPVGDLREYLSQQELRELVLIVHDILVSARDSDLAADLVDTAVEVFFDLFAERDLESLLAEFGFGRDELAADLVRLGPPVVAAAKADGTLAALIRARLEPFFHSAEVEAILKRPKPAA
jgi:hypothetical protein